MRLIDADLLKKRLYDCGERAAKLNGNREFIDGIAAAIEIAEDIPSTEIREAGYIYYGFGGI